MSLLRRRMMQSAGGEKVETGEEQQVYVGSVTWYTDGGEEKYTGGFSTHDPVLMISSINTFEQDTVLKITIKSDGGSVYPYFALTNWGEATNLYYTEIIGNAAWTQEKQNISAQYTVRAGYKFALVSYVSSFSKFNITIEKR